MYRRLRRLVKTPIVTMNEDSSSDEEDYSYLLYKHMKMLDKNVAKYYANIYTEDDVSRMLNIPEGVLNRLQSAVFAAYYNKNNKSDNDILMDMIADLDEDQVEVILSRTEPSGFLIRTLIEITRQNNNLITQ